MDVTLEKNGNVEGTLTISFKEADYAGDVKKELNELSRTRPIKGFRPGHVPAGLLQKYYGPQVKADVVDKQLSKALSDYIINNKLNILGEPMLSADTKVNLNTDKDFTFKFDLGFAPEFDLKIDKNVKIPYYNIEVSQKMLDEQNEANRKRYGRQVPGEEAAEDSVIRGSLTELNEDGTPKEGGITVEKTVIMPQYLKNEDEKTKFIGKKVNDEVVFNPYKAEDGNVTSIASMLNLEKEQADVHSDFKMTITEILINQEAEMNQEFFDNVLGKDVAKDEKTYFAKLKEMIGNQLKNDSNYRFTIDAENVLRKQVGTLELPDEFLKRFIKAQDKDKDEKKIEEEYSTTSNQLQWQLIKEKIARNLNVKIDAEDKMKLARFYAARQFAQYGMPNVPEDVIDNYAHKILENKDYSRDIENQAFEDKVFASLKDAVGIEEKNVSLDEFNKLFEKENK